jgi:hypothetical protein
VKDEKVANIAFYNKAIKDLAPRLQELHRVARECVANDIPLGERTRLHGSTHYPEFVSEWWYHRAGFVISQYPSPNEEVYFGITGGGADGQSLVIDCNGTIVKNPLSHVIGLWTHDNAYHDFCDKCKRFLSGFDDFEKRFYAYIDSL